MHWLVPLEIYGCAVLPGSSFPRPSSAASPIILGSSLRPLPFSSGPSPCPAFCQASDLAFYITEKIEDFNLHLLLPWTEPPSKIFISPVPRPGNSGNPSPSPPHPARPMPYIHCFHHTCITPKTSSPPALLSSKPELWESWLYWVEAGGCLYLHH